MRARGWSREALVFLPAVAAFGLLLSRLVRDVSGKPLFEDEAVAGLISARPLREVLTTVLIDRGGAPLHFVLGHVVLAFDSSAEALRALSVVFALGAWLAAVELGRRLGGTVAAATAGIAAATSGLLTIYGTFARMYALLAFVGGIAAVLFVRAVERRTARATLLAAIAAWFLPATHPYGGIALACEAAIALVLWRGRPLRPALPTIGVCLAALPFAFVDLRLAGRFDVGTSGERSLAGPGETWDQLQLAVRGSAGGAGVALVVFLALAAVGLFVLARERPVVAALAALWLLAPPLLFLIVRTTTSPDLSPRHLIYALPVWTAAVGVGAARLLKRVPVPVQAGALALLVLAGAFAPPGIDDPRSLTYVARLGGKDAVAEPAAALRAEVGPGDVLFPYSSVFLAALPETGRAQALPRAQPELLLRAMRRVHLPVARVLVAVPVGWTDLRTAPLRARLGPDFKFERLGGWLLVERHGPLDDRASVVAAAYRVIRAARDSTVGVVPSPLAAYYALNLVVLEQTERRLDSNRAG